jgi:hypothetical protein
MTDVPGVSASAEAREVTDCGQIRALEGEQLEKYFRAI